MLKKLVSKRFLFFIASLMLCISVCASSPALAWGEAEMQSQIDDLQSQIDALDPDSSDYESQKAALESQKQNLQDKVNEANERKSSNADKTGPDKRQSLALDDLFKCPSWGTMSSFNSKCGLCEVMLMFFDAANFMTESIATSLEAPMLKLMAVMLGLWLAFKTLVFFSTPASELDGPKFITDVLGLAFKGALGAGFIMGGCSFVFEYLLEPFLDSVSRMVTVIAGSSLSPSGTPMAYSGPISADIRSSLDGMIGGIMKPFADMKNIGFGLMCNGFFGIKIPSDKIAKMFSPLFTIPQIAFPSPFMIAFGLSIYITFAFVGFIYALTFVDVIMRFCLFLGFIPIVTVAWVFPATKKYASQCWRVFLNTALTFICTAVFLTMIVKIIENILGTNFMGKAYASNFIDAFLTLSFVKGLWIIEHFAINPFPLILVIAIGGFTLVSGTKIPDQVAGVLSGLGFEAIENCGKKAFINIVNAIIDLLLLVLTIVTWGATSFVQAIEPVQKSEETIRKLKKMKEYLEKLKKWRKRIAKAQQHFNNAVK